MPDRPTPEEVLAQAISDFNGEGSDSACLIGNTPEALAYVDCLTAAGYRIVPADQRTVADPDGRIPAGDVRICGASEEHAVAVVGIEVSAEANPEPSP